MLFWPIVVFLFGLIGLLEECSVFTFEIPLFGEAASIVLMLIALGMLYTAYRHAPKKDKK
jgi:small neutral amino acid transporter SnatA (MarC family)